MVQGKAYRLYSLQGLNGLDGLCGQSLLNTQDLRPLAPATKLGLLLTAVLEELGHVVYEFLN